METLLNMLISNRFRLSFEKTNEKCGDNNLHGEAFVRIYFEEYNKFKLLYN